jgi:hypothetical protein
VSEEALIPAAASLVRLNNQMMHSIVMLLWDILLDLDDLSPSTSRYYLNLSFFLLANIELEESFGARLHVADLPLTVVLCSETGCLSLSLQSRNFLP